MDPADLTDDVGLCGAFCVWLAARRTEMEWLNGRYLSAKWDVNELLSMKEAVIEGNLLKARLRLP